MMDLVISWAVLVAYVVGWAFSVRYFGRQMARAFARDSPHRSRSENQGDRVHRLIGACFLSLGWPVFLPGHWVFRVVADAEFLKNPVQLADEKAKRDLAVRLRLMNENEALRLAAEKYGLPTVHDMDGIAGE